MDFSDGCWLLSDLGLKDRPDAHLAGGVATVNDIVGWWLLGVVVGVAESGTFEVGPLGFAMVVVASTSFVVLRYAPRCLDRLSYELERRSGGQALTRIV